LDTLVHTVAEILVKESLLTKLRALQALDAMDIEAIYYLYSTLHNNSNAEGIGTGTGTGAHSVIT
jgi:hypothetical protein